MFHCLKCAGAIQADAGTGVLRRQAHGHHLLDALVRQASHALGDEGLPVAHTHVDADGREFLDRARTVQPLGQSRCLEVGQLEQWRTAADAAIALRDLRHGRLRQRPPAAHLEQELRDIFEPVRSAVRQQQHSPAVAAASSSFSLGHECHRLLAGLRKERGSGDSFHIQGRPVRVPRILD